MTLHTFTGGAVQTNGYILEFDDKTCFVVDAPAGMAGYLKGHELKATHLLVTHQHFDHVEDASALAEAGAKIHAYNIFDRNLIRDEQAREAWGISANVPDFTVNHLLEGESSLTLGDFTFALSHVPGHSPDSVSFYLESESLLFSGDALFAGCIGRTDLPGGSHEQLLDSIRKKLYILPDDVAVFPGHGPDTRIGKEKQSNHFCPA